MTRFGWSVALGFLIVLGIIAGAALLLHHKQATLSTSTEATSTEPGIDPSSLTIYTSGEYGFTLFYPAQASVTDAFSTTTTHASWRAGAIATGTLAVDIVLAPGNVRVGLSADSREVAVCTKVGPAEKAQPPVTVSSTTWNVFSYDKLGTDDEEHVVSYRTVRNHTCYALETFQPFSDTASTTQGKLSTIVHSFMFAP